tara:strand:+ start:282 stop:1433 length:1152 start_codon:yes stop_codon:yes gene_type:complete
MPDDLRPGATPDPTARQTEMPAASPRPSPKERHMPQDLPDQTIDAAGPDAARGAEAPAEADAQRGTEDDDAPITPEAWHARLDAHGEMHGYHERLGARHGALYTEDSETLLVTFEDAGAIRANGDAATLPFGLTVAGREGWSQLCLYSEGDTWFRDEALYAFFDRLIDEGFFFEFERVVFYGAGACAYAACAYSVAAPGAIVVAVQPQATLDPTVAEWDSRFLRMRGTDFTSRFGYAPAMMEAAAKGFVLYDPNVKEDAMHAALFTREGVEKLRCTYLGTDLEPALTQMDMLVPLLRAAGRGTLTRAVFADLWRRRRDYVPYLRRLVVTLESRERPMLAGLAARAVLSRRNGPRFRKALKTAEAQLAKADRSLPHARTLPPEA